MATNDMLNENSNPLVFAGVDIGGDSCRICVASSATRKINLHVNRVSNRQTPNIVSFDKRLRLYGEEADARITSVFNSTIPLSSYIVGLESNELKAYINSRRYIFGVELDENAVFNVNFNDECYSVYPTEVYFFLVNKLLETVKTEFNIPKDDNKSLSIAISVPLYFTELQKHKILQTLSLSSFCAVKLFKETDCLLKRWCDAQLPDAFMEFTQGNEKQSMKIAFLDVGFVHSSFFIAEIVKGDDDKFITKIVNEESKDTIGTYHMVELLCDYICGLIESTKGYKVKVPSKQSYTVYKSCMKALKDLSVLNDTKIDIDLIDVDFSTTLTRALLDDLTKNIKSNLRSMIEFVLTGLELDDLMAVEVLGGGSRIPFIKVLLEDVMTKLNANKTLRVSMDTTSSISYGAVALHLDDPTSDEFPLLDETQINEFNSREEFIQNIENEEIKKRSLLNEIDNYLIVLKNDAAGDYNEALSDPRVAQAIYSLETFSYTAVNDKFITSDKCLEELKSTQALIEESSPEYLKLKAIKEEEERKKEEEAQKRAAESTNSREEDMDVTLPKSTCIKRAQKNKDEGNILISTNVELAANHYIKAIQYCTKVKGVEDEELKQLNNLKLACYLNLSMVFFI